MIRDKNIAANAAIQWNKILGPGQVGNVRWLTSKTSNAYGWLRGKADTANIHFSLADAVGHMTANQGDILYVTPGYTETVTGAGGITIDVAGIDIIGLGGYVAKPTFLMDGSNAVTALITADDVRLSNFTFKAGHADIAIWGKVTGSGCTIDSCRFVENTATENWIDIIHAGTADNDYDGLQIINNTFIMNDAACVTAIDLLKNSADVVISGNRITGDFDASPYAPIYSASTEIHKDILITKNVIHNQHDGNAAVGISLANTASTGWIVDNDIGHQDIAGETPVLAGAAGLYVARNYASGVLGTASGYVYPALDS